MIEVYSSSHRASGKCRIELFNHIRVKSKCFSRELDNIQGSWLFLGKNDIEDKDVKYTVET